MVRRKPERTLLPIEEAAPHVARNKRLKNHDRGDDPREFYRLACIELVDDEDGRGL